MGAVDSDSSDAVVELKGSGAAVAPTTPSSRAGSNCSDIPVCSPRWRKGDSWQVSTVQLPLVLLAVSSFSLPVIVPG